MSSATTIISLKRHKAGLLCLLVFLFVAPWDLQAQRWTWGAGFGATAYKGELADWGYRPSVPELKETLPAVHLFVSYQERHAFTYRFQMLVSRIQGNIANRPSTLFPIGTSPTVITPNGKVADASIFATSITEFSGIVDYNFLDYEVNPRHFNWTPYFYGGLSAVFASPDKIDAFLTPAIPYGIGVKFQINKNWGVRGEFGSRKVFSDKLDQVATYDGNMDSFTLEGGDQYLHLGFSVTYTIQSIFCPKVY
ncbi:DUF6089 family protein [Aquirufa ecclesiirivi]|uniref:DUF6089 domain-containing protein n=1 Tax=Aquirufa ecclesiirivi TaxID=2715124 RepID=A0ABT4JI48_9BACT|nr:DUF6089 family protein [Aquirufa ecclesiirivi]MCZ2475954.1 hypothetical protein [Aquirufa ecclesiirivi]